MVKQRGVSSFKPYNWFYNIIINVMFPTICNPNLNFSECGTCPEIRAMGPRHCG